MPNRAYDNDEMTSDIQNEYYLLSRELGIPLVDVVGELMPTKEATPYSWYRDDGFNVHLSLKGQYKVAELILSKILPKY
jgi:lysophospholipase L1-like esterase